jgi:hypothetical protein
MDVLMVIKVLDVMSFVIILAKLVIMLQVTVIHVLKDFSLDRIKIVSLSVLLTVKHVLLIPVVKLVKKDSSIKTDTLIVDQIVLKIVIAMPQHV